MNNEQAMYLSLPEQALIEVPAHLLVEFRMTAYPIRERFHFELDDLVEDALGRTMSKEMATEYLEEWFDEVSCDLQAEDWFDDASMQHLNTIGKLMDHLANQMNLLRTPSGFHYYHFDKWFDQTTLLLSKKCGEYA